VLQRVELNSGVTETLFAVWGSSPTDVWAVGAASVILHYDGATWTRMPVTFNDQFNGVWGFSATDVFIVGAEGLCLRWDGFSWSQVATGTSLDLKDVWGDSASDVWAVGEGGTILYFNGISWAAQTSGTTDTLNGVWGSSPTDVYAVGDNGTIRVWNGAIWTASPVEGSPLLELFSIWGFAVGEMVAVGEDGAVFRWETTEWIEMVSEAEGDLYDVWGSLTDGFYAVGEEPTEVLKFGETLWNPVSTFTLTDLMVLPFPVIEKLKFVAMMRNAHRDLPAGAQLVLDSGGLFLGATATLAHIIQNSEIWQMMIEEWRNDPANGWPSGIPSASPWIYPEIDAIEAGVRADHGQLRCTSLGAEVWQTQERMPGKT
jgi:hypothetical protein